MKTNSSIGRKYKLTEVKEREFFSVSKFVSGFFAMFSPVGWAKDIVGLFNVINREIGAFACVAGSYCTPAIIAGSLTAGLLGLAWVMACVNWWRTGSTGN